MHLRPSQGDLFLLFQALPTRAQEGEREREREKHGCHGIAMDRWETGWATYKRSTRGERSGLEEKTGPIEVARLLQLLGKECGMCRDAALQQNRKRKKNE